jgi:hypothetical protein
MSFPGSTRASRVGFGALAETFIGRHEGELRKMSQTNLGDQQKFAIARARSPAREARALPRLRNPLENDY